MHGQQNVKICDDYCCQITSETNVLKPPNYRIRGTNLITSIKYGVRNYSSTTGNWYGSLKSFSGEQQCFSLVDFYTYLYT